MTEIISFVSIAYPVDCQMHYIFSFLLKKGKYYLYVTVMSMTMECEGMGTRDALDLIPETITTLTKTF
jgi:hypothetical protein